MEQNKNQIEAVKKFIKEEVSNQAVDLLRTVTENCVHLSGTTYGIDERYIDKVTIFLSRITD